MTGIIGGDVHRDANAPLLAGTAQYAADLRRDGEVHVRLVRSPVAHARITGIDVSEAAAHPGVVAVLTADDLPDVRIPIRLPLFETPEANRFLQPPLAREVVRYVGEPIAAVVATDPYLAEDAAELVDIDLDELPPVTGIADAEAAEPIHPAAGTNVVGTVPLRHGDVDAAFAAADIVVRERFRMHRHTAVPMETRGLLAEVDEITDRLTLWGGAKVKHSVRQALAGMLGIDAERIRVAEVNVGGGFGVRGETYPEDFLVAFLALRLRRPVKWVEDRAEHFVATNHAREQEHELEIAATADGRLLAFRDRAVADHGGYVRSQGILPELLPAQQIAGPYRWEAFAVEATGVITNRTPVGTYRGPGMTEVTFVRERLLDMLAARVGADPAELRRRNLIPPEAMPFTFAMDEGSAVPGLTYESGDYPAALDALLDAAGYDGLRREVAERRAGGECAGIGLAAYIEIGAIGPFEEARVVPDRAGGFTVHVATGSLGQGAETVFAQIVADALRVRVEDVRVDFSDTDEIPMGFGAFASRSTPIAGNAALLAARDLRAKAAEALGADPDDVEFGAGLVRAGGASLPVGKVGEGRARFDKPHPTFSFGGALSLVTVDRATGRVRVQRHVVMHDVGRAVNPALVRGQLAGAASQGIGGALLEELLYDAQGQPLSTTFGDYRMPTASELPEIEVVVVEHRPPESNPLGAKGAGEAGMVATPAAVANAVADALGLEVTRLPLTPDRVRSLLRDAGR
ncbi:xanthine dehydrogenase family protein molybdopterin-binding subunit [Spirillospora sp. NPDC048819]|uniref:xanthine dehydrogenase family protein molybdopterin-binding subunit n=1 Tax=Spirillospora sp. NPDC048819 TaxID=3155268 RepID=UPI0033D0B781